MTKKIAFFIVYNLFAQLCAISNFHVYLFNYVLGMDKEKKVEVDRNLFTMNQSLNYMESLKKNPWSIRQTGGIMFDFGMRMNRTCMVYCDHVA